MNQRSVQRTVYPDAFWIDRTETATVQHQQCVQEGACPPPRDTSTRDRETRFPENLYNVGFRCAQSPP